MSKHVTIPLRKNVTTLGLKTKDRKQKILYQIAHFFMTNLNSIKFYFFPPLSFFFVCFYIPTHKSIHTYVHIYLYKIHTHKKKQHKHTNIYRPKWKRTKKKESMFDLLKRQFRQYKMVQWISITIIGNHTECMSLHCIVYVSICIQNTYIDLSICI